MPAIFSQARCSMSVLPEKPEMPSGLNTPSERMLENIKVNIQRGLPQAKAYQNSNETVILAYGGPSLKRNLKALKKLTPTCPLVTVNGVHDYLISEGCVPSVQIMLDARPDNVCFVQNPVETCKYLVASQCDPSVFGALEGYDVHIFHCDLGVGEDEVFKDYYLGENYRIIMGGSTVGLRALILMRTLGFSKFEIFGFDSCFLGNEHHSFQQDLNAKDAKAVKLEGLGRTFYCTGWMLRQAYEFQDLVKHAGKLLKCRIHGNGLIANMVKAGAQLKES